MLELTAFPYLPPGNPGKAVLALIHLCRELPPPGEQFRFFRNRMKQYKLWDQERIQGTLDFLGMQRTGTVKPSPLALSIKAQKTDDKAREVVAQRLWEVNPLLFKVVLDLLKERVYSRDEIIKHIDSFAYRGKKPPRPQLEGWLHMALGLDILKLVGIALDLGPRAEMFTDQAKELEVDDFLEEVAEAGSAAASGAEESAGEPADDEVEEADSAADEPPAPASAAPQAAKPPAVARAATPAARAPAPATRGLDLDAGSLSSPRGQHPAVALLRFAGHAVFPDDVLAETTERVEAWWSAQPLAQAGSRAGATAADFGLDATAWMEGAEEALYRVAVAAALIFRLGRTRAQVQEVFAGLDRAGVLRDLYYGTAPDALPGDVDPRALMLASLVARRSAEAPELAATLEKQASATAALEVLDAALGRGFFKIELFWMMSALEDMGALRFDDLATVTALPRRLVRDTLFRLGYLDTPYAHDASSLVPAARAARRAAGASAPPDEVLVGFALAAGCAYDCPVRKSCEHACRERAE